jgi:predicted NUDIX family phosphoesterase
MNVDVLGQFKEAVETTISQYSGYFKQIEYFDTTNTTALQGTEQITRQTLAGLRNFLDEKILVIPKDKIDLPKEGFYADLNKFNELSSLVNSEPVFMARSLVEDNDDYIQPIPCGIITHDNRYLLLRRKELDKHHPLHDTFTLWAGGHGRTSDKKNNDILQTALRRELNEELNIAQQYKAIPLGLVRTCKDERAARHLGVVYRIEVSDSKVAIAMDQEEFREIKGRSVSGGLIELEQISKYRPSMANWSKYIFDYLKQEPKLFQ